MAHKLPAQDNKVSRYEFLRNPGKWLAGEAEKGVVASSRIRLARNLEDYPFPGRTSAAQAEDIMKKVRQAAVASKLLNGALFFDMSDLDPLDKEILKERRLTSMEFGRRGSALLVAEKEHVAIMVNEEDHLRIQAMDSGLCLGKVLEVISAVDLDLEKRLDYAFSPRYGYLTACPSNVGTGMRASVMLHLPGLCLMDEIDQVINGFHRTGFEVRGILGEGSVSSGNIFQISNRVTLGINEKDTISTLERVSEDVIQHELNARGRLLSTRRERVRDHVSRALGVLLYAELLSSREAIDLLSALKLGLEMGIVKNITLEEIDDISVLTQPGHLQKIKGKKHRIKDRDRMRSKLVRDKLQSVKIAARVSRAG
ncbi:MAG: ATP--guanido phosphotransferase [Verrucomicrobiota bacterium]